MAKAGGPATIHGIFYQMLWSLLQALGEAYCKVTLDPKGVPVTATVVLEPSTGGDLLVISPTFRIVEQIKTTQANTWSFREVVEQVLPDLYKAVDIDNPHVEYRFVTNARTGKWKDAYDFFAELRTVSSIDDVSDSQKLAIDISPSETKDSFNIDGIPTKRNVLTSINDFLCKGFKSDVLTADEALKRTCHLLSRFRLDGSNLLESVERQIDLILTHFTPDLNQVKNARLALVSALEERVTKNKGELGKKEIAELFDQHGLNKTSLREWSVHRRKSIEITSSFCSSHGGYTPEDDVRPFCSRLLQDWPSPKTPILALVGESGNGKSWSLYSLANLLARDYPQLVVALDSSQKSKTDLQTAADTLWHSTAGFPKGNDLPYVHQRFSNVIPGLVTPWLVVLIDGLNDEKSIIELCKHAWPAQGIALVFATSDTAWNHAKPHIPSCFEQITVGKFTAAQRDAFIRQQVPGFEVALLDSHMASLTAKPVLAQIFCKTVIDNPEFALTPHEAEQPLLLAYWETRNNAVARQCLAKAALSLLQGKPYPWNTLSLIDSGMNEEIITSLTRSGWLSKREDAFFYIWHDRLLSWAAAYGLDQAFYAQEIQPKEAANLLAIAGVGPVNGHILTDIIPDYTWLVSQRKRRVDDLPPHADIGV